MGVRESLLDGPGAPPAPGRKLFVLCAVVPPFAFVPSAPTGA
jgi:hypothetical protein